MLIPVVLKDGHEELVSKDELRSLMFNKQVMSFKRSDGWVVLGRDKRAIKCCQQTFFVFHLATNP